MNQSLKETNSNEVWPYCFCLIFILSFFSLLFFANQFVADESGLRRVKLLSYYVGELGNVVEPQRLGADSKWRVLIVLFWHFAKSVLIGGVSTLFLYVGQKLFGRSSFE
jgi:hypothetical protein